ncbi:hypothetical protein [Congregibacter sp.]|jgi:hypothetical protein|uniref:hypothetical protein n=1 Tax=Congregibacter sp. TaxID=2744308 RepID=UPI0039E4C2F9
MIALQNNGDDAARAAWSDRMDAVHHRCSAVISALKKDEKLIKGLSTKEATDLLWSQLSLANWECLRQRCAWSQARYIKVTRQTARQTLI